MNDKAYRATAAASLRSDGSNIIYLRVVIWFDNGLTGFDSEKPIVVKVDFDFDPWSDHAKQRLESIRRNFEYNVLDTLTKRPTRIYGVRIGQREIAINGGTFLPDDFRIDAILLRETAK